MGYQVGNLTQMIHYEVLFVLYLHNFVIFQLFFNVPAIRKKNNHVLSSFPSSNEQFIE